MPPALIGDRVAVGGRGLEKAIVGFPEPPAEILRYLLGVGGQIGAPEEVRSQALPAALVDEEVVETAEPLAVANREIPGLDLVTELHEQRAFPRLRSIPP